uniref:Uncharacterized protein n=1 Tax=Manihot esculenta TaxID=3983 RepID=A0A199U998_MANES
MRNTLFVCSGRKESMTYNEEGTHGRMESMTRAVQSQQEKLHFQSQQQEEVAALQKYIILLGLGYHLS